MRSVLPKSVRCRLVISRVLLISCALISAGMLAAAVLGATQRGHRERVEIRSKTRDSVRPRINQSGINLNTAAKEELMTLPGIGKYLAEQLIFKREDRPFYFIEYIGTVKGFGDKRIAALKPLAFVPLPPNPESPDASSGFK